MARQLLQVDLGGCSMPGTEGWFISLVSDSLREGAGINKLSCLLAGWGRGCDILIFYSPDAEEWCQYLQDLFVSCRQVRSQKMQTYRLGPDASFSAEDLLVFRNARCMLVLLSAGLVECFCRPGLLPMLQRAFHPPRRVVRLLCGVQSRDENFQAFFPEWEHWQELTCDDEPETYLAAVRKAISEGKGSWQREVSSRAIIEPRYRSRRSIFI